MKNLPDDFLKDMQKLFENNYIKFLDTYNNESYTGLRANTLKISKPELKAIADFVGDEIPWSQDGFYYENNQRPAKSPLYHAGLYYIQEPSAMSVINNIEILPGMKVLDICAAPGGKTVNIAAKLKNNGLLVTNDINNQRTKAILKNIELYAITNTLVTNETHQRLEQIFPDYFDRIILDAPCSGEGMFRKDDSLIKSWQRSKKDSIPVQKELLDACAKMLKSDGLLIYSTCTFNQDENENQIIDFLSRNKDFLCIGIPKEYGLTSRENLPQSARLLPHNLKGEGHFLCLMKKVSDNNYKKDNVLAKQLEQAKNISDDSRYFQRDKLPREYLDFENQNLNIILNGNFVISNDKLYKEIYTDNLPKGFKVIRNGLYIGEIKNQHFIPSQAFIMTLSKADFKNFIDLDQSNPLVMKYLKGETIFIEDKIDGFYAIGVNGYVLGYGKLQNEKLKNGYNKNWRIN